MNSNLLLLSNSVVYGKQYLEHAWDALREFLGDERIMLFVPYALSQHDTYTASIQTVMNPLGISVVGVHETGNPRLAVEQARVLFVGGGNSFRLLKDLYHFGLLEPVHRRVVTGELRYIGSSAGTNMACPSLRTTNDMPIVRPPSFTAFD